ncbi:hypothetical protein L2E82_25523 [Cichorium intybus]|uniref:Uncharacterized protein n=1 Tax=Cichorium intybus TaxID=13427 RepID=A0ACB9E3I0_CICIN|nr:hypothetical protein L2E82_25523 [Cichorium intybus]
MFPVTTSFNSLIICYIARSNDIFCSYLNTMQRLQSYDAHIEFLICVILLSMSIFSIIIFVCGDSDHQQCHGGGGVDGGGGGGGDGGGGGGGGGC